MMSDKVNRYILAVSPDMRTLVTEVQKQIDDLDAQPIGGVSWCILETDDGPVQHFLQALVTYESPIQMMN